MFKRTSQPKSSLLGHMSPAGLGCELFAVESNYRWVNIDPSTERQM